MMWLDAKVKGESGDWNGAANSCLDSIQFGVQVPRGGNVITSLVGIAIQNGGRKGLKQVIPNLSAVEAKLAESRLEAILSTQTPFLETLREESRSSKTEMIKSIPNVPLVKPLYLGYYSNGIKMILAEAQKPYPQRSLDPKAVKSNIFYALVADTWLKTGFKYEQNNVNLSFLALSLGLHAYKKEHGNYPGALEALVPAYLSKLPDDPFASKGSFQYKRKGDKYLLYSVGPDGKDDGGKAIDVPNNPNAKTNKFARYFPADNSVGDIVAGTNDF